MRVAFIGLGTMGSPMAANLLSAGHALTVYNRTAAKAEPLEASGATVAGSPDAAAAQAQVVCTCVSTSDALRAVVLGDCGALAGAHPGALFVDFSTVDPGTSNALAAACGSRGCGFLEAPVSGGVRGAVAGKLTIMVGGAEEDHARARPIFDVVSQRCVRVGGVGSASHIKLINQTLMAANLAAVIEGFVLGALAGIDPQVLYEVVSESSGDSRALRRAVPNNILPGDFNPGFTVELLLKDLGLALGLADELGAPLGVAGAARAVYADALAAGLGKQDISAAILPREQWCGVMVRAGEGSGDRDHMGGGAHPSREEA